MATTTLGEERSARFDIDGLVRAQAMLHPAHARMHHQLMLEVVPTA